MDDESLVQIVGGEVVPLQRSTKIPSEVVALLDAQAELWLERPVLTIGSWQTFERPELLVLDQNGTLHSWVVEDPESPVSDRLTTIEEWLASQSLRELGTHTDDPLAFYEQLWDLSPDAPIALQGYSHHVLTANRGADDASLPVNGPVVMHEIEVYTGEPDITIVRSFKSSSSAGVQQFATEAPEVQSDADALEESVSEVEADADAQVEGDEHIDLVAIEKAEGGVPDVELAPVVLTEVSDEPEFEPPTLVPPPINPDILETVPKIRQGGVFRTERLPMLFDPLGTDLVSISNELFAVGHNLVIVEKVPEKRRSGPFQSAAEFRWDTDAETLEQLHAHREHDDGTLRTLHLFVESDRPDSLSMYVGVLQREGFQSNEASDTAWFTIEPELPLDLFRQLKKGRLPQLDLVSTVDLAESDSV